MEWGNDRMHDEQRPVHRSTSLEMIRKSRRRLSGPLTNVESIQYTDLLDVRSGTQLLTSSSVDRGWDLQ